jgi:DNA replication and repair protein RecF
MYLKHLYLENFRNYNEATLELEQEINVFYGDNAQGKTNIIEAIYFLALAKSHRTSKEKELIKIGNSFSLVKGKVKHRNHETKQEILLTPYGKKAKINNNEIKKISEYVGYLNVVIFSPEDLNIVKGGPAYRRRFLDIEIGQINASYLYHLVQYQRVMQQRNNFLKELNVKIMGREDELTVWNAQLIEHGVKIILKRIQYIELIGKWLQPIHTNISEDAEKLTIDYSCSLIERDSMIEKREFLSEANEEILTELFITALQRYQRIEIIRGVTLVGPHRDDLIFNINEQNVLIYGSQGQQRTAALSLKLAELELINHYNGEYPILLLDDVLSELDQRRQTFLLKGIENKVQTLLTTTTLAGIEGNQIKNKKIHYVENGKITKVGK